MVLKIVRVVCALKYCRRFLGYNVRLDQRKYSLKELRVDIINVELVDGVNKFFIVRERLLVYNRALRIPTWNAFINIFDFHSLDDFYVGIILYRKSIVLFML